MKPEQPGRSALGEMELCRRAPSSPSPMELDQPPNFGPRRTYAAVDVDAENLPPGHRPPSPCTPPRMQTKSKGKFDLSKQATKRRREDAGDTAPSNTSIVSSAKVGSRNPAQEAAADAAMARSLQKRPASTQSLSKWAEGAASESKSAPPVSSAPSMFTGPSVAGLFNLGNTCYMNAVLQALRRCDKFRRGLEVSVEADAAAVTAAAADAAVGEVSEDMSEDVTASAANDSGSDSDTSGPSCVGAVVDEAGPADDPAGPSAGEAMSGGLKAGGLLHALHALFSDMEAAEMAHMAGTKYMPSVRPRKIHAALGVTNEMFNNTRQHDAQEFMHCLLDNLQEAEAAIAGGESTEHHPPPRGATAALQGSLVYETRCCECEGSTNRVESFVDLTLTVEPTSTRSVSHSLTQLCEVPERLNGPNKYFCETCNRFTEATRNLLVMNLPEVLVLHLNRSSGGTKKVSSHVDAPRHLSLHRWSKDKDPSKAKARYGLSAIIFHSGQSSLSGHYTCYARTPVPDDASGALAWAFFDDESVEFVSDEYVHSLLAPFSTSRATAYILFYQRLASDSCR